MQRLLVGQGYRSYVKSRFSSHTNEFTRECHMDNAETKVISKLNDREKKQAALPIAVFGMEMVMQVSHDSFD